MTTITEPPLMQPTDLTVVAYPDNVGLLLHTVAVELRVDADDADAIASSIDRQVTSSTAGCVTVSFDAHNSIEVATAEAKRLAIELHHAAADSRRLHLTRTLTGRFTGDITRAASAADGPGADRDGLYARMTTATTIGSAMEAATSLIQSGEPLPQLLHAIWGNSTHQ